MSYRVETPRPLVGLAGAAFFLVMTGCHTYNPLPLVQTDGSYANLPNATVKAAVWGTRQEGVQSLTTWLLKRGLTVVDDVKMNQIASELHSIRTGNDVTNVEVFKLGKLVGAKQVVFIDTDVSTWRVTGIENLFGQTPTTYGATVYIRALDTESGEIQWSGKAASMDTFTNLKEGIHQLTCHALATAWGLRQPGTVAAANICPPGQNIMISNHAPKVAEHAGKPDSGLTTMTTR